MLGDKVDAGVGVRRRGNRGGDGCVIGVVIAGIERQRACGIE